MTRYIGIPYLEKGRDFNGADCYGIVSLWYKNELGILIPEVNVTDKQIRRSYAKFLDEISKHWQKCEVEKNAVVAMSLSEEHPKMVTHFGVMIDDKRMLHTHLATSSHIVDISDMRVAGNIRGFYKWQS